MEDARTKTNWLVASALIFMLGRGGMIRPQTLASLQCRDVRGGEEEDRQTPTTRGGDEKDIERVVDEREGDMERDERECWG